MTSLTSAFKSLFLIALITLSCSACDKCKDVSCENEGICTEGECECVGNYEGESCEQQITPTLIKINKVTFTGTQSLLSTGWDPDTDEEAPDVNMVIQLEGLAGDWFTSPELFENTTASNLVFEEDLPVQYSEVYRHVTFSIWNRDLTNGEIVDNMFWITTPLYSNDNGFERTVIVPHADGITLEVEIEYVF